MEIFGEIGPLQAFLDHQRSKSQQIGLVPTMGALHAGHSSLIQASRAQNDLTVCSLFVNPTQFNSPDDLAKYPRTPREDIRLLESEGCDVLFMPENTVMYSKSSVLKLDFGELDKIFEGNFRPGHFNGVGLVVSKLFNIVRPHQAYFGQKDYQQFAIIRLLARELQFNIRLHCLPTVREQDGLAMSSRNLRLAPSARTAAPLLYQTLLKGKENLRLGQPWPAVRDALVEDLKKKPAIRIDYFERAHRENLLNRENVSNRDAILLIAGFVGDVRLIDNLFVEG